MVVVGGGGGSGGCVVVDTTFMVILAHLDLCEHCIGEHFGLATPVVHGIDWLLLQLLHDLLDRVQGPFLVDLRNLHWPYALFAVDIQGAKLLNAPRLTPAHVKTVQSKHKMQPKHLTRNGYRVVGGGSNSENPGVWGAKYTNHPVHIITGHT